MPPPSYTPLIEHIWESLKKHYRPQALRELGYTFLVFALFSGLYIAIPHFGYVWTWSGSLPVGLWKKNNLRERSAYVSFCLQHPTYARFFRDYMMPDDDSHYPCPYGIPRFMKPIKAKVGDTIQLTRASALINNVPLANSETTSKSPALGIRVPQIQRGYYKVEAGTVWVFSTYNKASYDSRYYGAIPVSWIEDGVEPAFVYANPPDFLLSSPSNHPIHCLWRFCWISPSSSPSKL
jgi:conjugative transfer signal peptidase TraF